MTTTATLHGFSGILFMGDTHVASGRIGRRVDDYAAACLDKLRQAAALSKAQNLFPIHLGDLFHRAKENDLTLLGQLMAVLREFPTPPCVIAGSHDRQESWFTQKDAAQLLADVGVVKLWQTPGLVQQLKIGSETVRLFVTPAGAAVPTEVPPAVENHTTTIMVTHHDFDFNGKYPDAHELHEILNCDILVNGHMHTPTPVVVKGQTACHNPGSMLRPTVDLKKHEPAVSIWMPEQGQSLLRHTLRYQKDVFDLTGKEVFAADPKELKESLPKGLRLSSFAAKLRGSETLEASRSDDGSVLVEELQNYFNLFDKPDNLKRYITAMLAEVVEAKS